MVLLYKLLLESLSLKKNVFKHDLNDKFFDTYLDAIKFLNISGDYLGFGGFLNELGKSTYMFIIPLNRDYITQSNDSLKDFIKSELKAFNHVFMKLSLKFSKINNTYSSNRQEVVQNALKVLQFDRDQRQFHLFENKINNSEYTILSMDNNVSHKIIVFTF